MKRRETSPSRIRRTLPGIAAVAVAFTSAFAAAAWWPRNLDAASAVSPAGKQSPGSREAGSPNAPAGTPRADIADTGAAASGTRNRQVRSVSSASHVARRFGQEGPSPADVGRSGTAAGSHRARATTAALVGAETEMEPRVTPELAFKALLYVGVDPEAEKTWLRAVDDPNMPEGVRSDLIEDLNDEGYEDPAGNRLTQRDLPLILARLELIERLAPYAMDRVNADAFEEAYKDLLNMYVRLATGAR